jgi:hypothetical protein
MIPSWCRSGLSAEPRLAFEEGEPGPYRSLIDGYIENRSENYVPAAMIAMGSFRLGRYDEHMEWVEQQEKEAEALHLLKSLYVGFFPNYWEALGSWASGDPARTAALSAHRARFERITQNMHLP